MKKRNFWTVLLLLSFSFSIVHVFAIEANEIEHCSVQEYVQEFSQSNDCGDVCDIHHMFHMSYITVNALSPMEFDTLSFTPIYNPRFYIGHNPPSAFRPPIAA